jgi:threonyl-tRNA synthetase
MWRSFGFEEVKAYLATRPEKAVGEDAAWEKALVSLRHAIERESLPYEMDEGGGAFYGPKIDLKIKDALGREWQMTTIQFDFNLPERFSMVYVDADGQEKRPFMVHRALLGSLERFFGVLVEHYGGAFPSWLAPVQVVAIPVAGAFDDYCRGTAEELRRRGVRVEADLSDSRMNAKIRNAQRQKVPFMLVLGEREEADAVVSVRTRDGEQHHGMGLDELVELVRQDDPRTARAT